MTTQNSKKIQIFILIGFLASAFFLFFWQYRYQTIQITLKNQNLNLLVAKTNAQQYRGLGGRADFGKYDGMIFVFDEYYQFGIVMRDMRFPIDIVWLKDGEVVDYFSNAPLEPGVSESNLKVYRPRLAANSVIELKSGWTIQHDLKIGDRLSVVKE